MRMRRDDTQFHSIPPQLKQLLADAAERLPPSRYDCPNPMQLLDFINKNLSKSTRIRIAAHLRCCRKCLRDLDDVLRARAACDNSPPCESTAAHLRVDRRTIIPEFLTAWIREQHGRAVLTIPGKIPLTLWREHGLLHISIPADHVDVRLILDGLEVFPSASVSADNSKTFQFKNSPSPPRSPGRFLAWQAEILQDGALIRLRYKLRISRDSQTANTVQDGFMLVAAATDGERLASAPVLRSFGIVPKRNYVPLLFAFRGIVLAVRTINRHDGRFNLELKCLEGDQPAMDVSLTFALADDPRLAVYRPDEGVVQLYDLAPHTYRIELFRRQSRCGFVEITWRPPEQSSECRAPEMPV